MARAPALPEIEALPEADRLEGFPHPRETEELYRPRGGRARARARRCAADRMHHGWLIGGAKGSARRRSPIAWPALCWRAPDERAAGGASLAVGEETRGRAPGARAVASGAAGHAAPLRREGKRFGPSIPVDEVRRLRAFLGHRAAEAAWRVVIVDSADELNVNAANALLKSLEEPPARTVFLLVSSAPGGCCRPSARAAACCRCSRLHGDALRAAATQALAAADRPDAGGGRMGRAGAARRRQRAAACSISGTLTGWRCRSASASSSRGCRSVDWRAVHTLADELQPIAAQDALRAVLRAAARRPGAPHPRAGRGRGQARGPGAGRPPHRRAAACLVRRAVGNEWPAKRPTRWHSISTARH